MSISTSSAGIATAAANQVATEQSYDEERLDPLQVQERYNQEREKRLRDDGIDQYFDISLAEKFQQFQNDPFVDETTVKDAHSLFPDNRCQMLILGAGFGGLMYAVRMVQAGLRPENLRIVDIASGFGGTWYYNRYPGLQCDIESYCYLPLLEETDYVPKHRFSQGHEIREYADLVARKYNVADSAVFLTKAEKLVWDDAACEWQVDLVQTLKGQTPQKLNIRSQFVVTANGVLNWPKLPGIPGILDYRGTMFHSSRWDYSITGGSQAEPSLTKLQDKRVAIIGTGCSAVQIIPHLARWATHLYVVQRTPASVDTSGQRVTDPKWFRKEVANSPGWQRERLRNFHHHFTTGKQPEVNLVDDQFTHATSMVALTGNTLGPKTVDELPAYVKSLHDIDRPRLERIRAHIDEVVKDPKTADKLKPWYPSWCKRPTFHDGYLQTFNRDNVTLIDTDGKDLDSITENSIIFNRQSYPVDLIIFATGFRPPYAGTPAEKANVTISGRNGVSMTEAWTRDGPKTLHGILDYNFPNLFLSGPWQASTSPNYLFGEDNLARHAAYVWAEASRRADGKPFTVKPTPAAAEDWAQELLIRSAPMGAILGCTPSYFNQEGMLDKVPPEMQVQFARSGLWGHGIEDFLNHIEAWRADGHLKGLEVQVEA